MIRHLVVVSVCVAALLALLLAQQPGGIDEIRARSAADQAYQAAYASQLRGRLNRSC